MHVDERITAPLVRDGGELREVSWERALEVAGGLARHNGHVGALVGGQTTNEEGFLLQRLVREALDSNDIDSRVGGPVDLNVALALADPSLQATVPDLEFAHTVLVVGCEPLDDAPIFDLRIRKGVRRRGVSLAIATARPSALDPNAQLVVRYAPGDEARFLAELAAALAGEARSDLAKLLREGGEDVVIVWGERIGGEAAALLLNIASSLGLGDREGAGLLEIPAGSNGRGLREVGVLPNSGPGYANLSGTPAGARRRSRAQLPMATSSAVPAPDRPGARSARPCAVGGRASSRGVGRRARDGADGGHQGARERGVPGRVPRREGGHGRAS